MSVNFKTILIAALISIITAYGTVKIATPSHSMLPVQKVEKNETSYDRIMNSGTLRCGYIVWPPEFNKDPNTGEFSGVAYDVITEVAKRLDLKIDWVEEVNFSTMAAALKANRFDAICFSLYRDAPRAKFARFTLPIFYSGTGVFVRADDTRFDNMSVSDLNNEQYTIATMDGEMSAITASARFPKAKQVTVPNTANATDLLLNVASNKADLTLSNTLVGTKFMHSNPGQLKNIATDGPIQVFSHGFAFQHDAGDIVAAIDIVLQEMHDQGIIDRILDNYPLEAAGYYRAAKLYNASEKN